MQRYIASAVAELVLGGSLVAEQFLDRDRDLAPVCPQLLPRGRVFGESDRGIADELHDSLGFSAAKHQSKPRDLNVGQIRDTVVVSCVDPGEPAHHVVLRLGPPLLDQVEMNMSPR